MQIDRKKLVCAMIDAELSTKELAKRSGVSRQTISYIKNGKTCAEETVEKIADALKMEKSSLLKEG